MPETTAPDRAPAATRPPTSLGALFAATVFLSAFLLFQVQPLVSRAILPWFGGTTGVWTVCMLFFQTLLFAGYSYSHLVTVRLEPRARTVLHLVLVATACALLPILPEANWKPGGEESPTLRIVLMLLASVGLPFFVLSTTGPLLQAWFAETHPGRSPYRLYALSNLGSLLALLTYPFVVEPLLGLGTQSAVWSATFVLFALAGAVCGVAAVRYRVDGGRTPEVTGGLLARPETPEADAGRPGAGTLVLWFVLASVPSVMLLATTNEVCLDVASVPFLWVLPLSLYLVSFVLCFDADRWYSRGVFGVAVLLTSGAVVWALAAGPSLSLVQQIAMYFAALFACAMFCHGELAAMKPDPRHLTLFYLVLAAGGAAGGLFTGLVAPLVFTGYYELHLAILATAVLVLVIDERAARREGEHADWSRPVLVATVAVIAVGLAYEVRESGSKSIRSVRNFYGVLRVQEFPQGPEAEGGDPTGPGRRLMHGRIAHGKQYDTPPQQDWPTMYYGRAAGVGLALEHEGAGRPARVGIVGLGVGTLAAYAKRGDVYRFYEINPAVVEIAREEFRYLVAAEQRGATIETVVADARLALERERSQRFDVLAVDAFSSDSIPTHLLTREAVAIYLRHLAADGVLAFHVSNKHFDLTPVLAAHAETFDLHLAYVVDVVDASRGVLTGTMDSDWVLLGRDRDTIRAIERRHEASPSAGAKIGPNRVEWTDDATNLVEVLRN